MGWFKSLFSSGVSTVVDSVGNAIDKLVTSDEEKLLLKNALQKEMNDFEKSQMSHITDLEQQVTDRHKSDMTSDSWLSKNVRPISLVFLTATTMLLAYLSIFSDLTDNQLKALDSWLPLIQVLLVTSYSFYFGGRSIEKFRNMSFRNKDK